MRKISWPALLAAAMLPAAARAEVRLLGRVIDETKVAVPGAAVSLRPAATRPDSATLQRASAALRAVTDQGGAFTIVVQRSGAFLLQASREGFFVANGIPVDLSDGENEIQIELHHIRELHESVDVVYSPHAIDMQQTSVQQSVGGNDVLQVPYPSSHSLNNALRILPGAVMQDARGDLHFNGGAIDQTLWTLDGFNITDPLTGTFDTQLNVEAARSLTLSSGLYSAEFGKGSAGALAIDTSTGDDRFRYGATNFVPSFETRKGFTLGSWRPRFTFSGPVIRGRAWFFNSTDGEYSNEIVNELPAGRDRTKRYRFSNYLRGQFNLTPSHILYAGILNSTFDAPRSGLGLLDPYETTVDRRSHQTFAHLKDQLYLSSGAVLEIGYANNRTFGRAIPQGPGRLIFTPDGRRGNFFMDARRWARRDQWLADAILPSFSFAGSHRVKIGVDLDTLEYRQDIGRTGYDRLRVDGSLSRRVFFAGNGQFERSNTEAAWYFDDSWKLRPKLVLQLGLRQDWDRLTRTATLSPRAGFGWSPPGLENTKITGGFGIVHDAASLSTFTRQLDQHTLTTTFGPAGTAETGPLVTLFTIEPARRRMPRYRNWSLGVEQRLPGDFHLRADYLRKRGQDGFTFVNTFHGLDPALSTLANELGGVGFDAIYDLRNTRRDVFDSAAVTVRKTFRERAVWLASYTRSRAVSNAALDISIDNPTLVNDNFGPMPWDSPNRLLSWSYFPLTKKWSLSYMLEWRSGFPYSVEDDEGRVVGGVNSHRLPDFVELNLFLERQVPLFGQIWALRGGFVNALNRQNPTAVNNNLSSANFGQFSGGTSRAFVARIRWLGKR